MGCSDAGEPEIAWSGKVRDAGVWLRLQLPDWLQMHLEPLDLYQWLGLALAALASGVGARMTVASVSWLVARLLRRSGSALSGNFVAMTLKPLTWLATAWIFFFLLAGLDLPVAFASPGFAAEKFILAALFGWLAWRLMDLSMGIYTNADSLRPASRASAAPLAPPGCLFGIHPAVCRARRGTWVRCAGWSQG